MQCHYRPQSAGLPALGLLLALLLWLPVLAARDLLYPPAPPQPLPEPVSLILQGEAVPPAPTER